MRLFMELRVRLNALYAAYGPRTCRSFIPPTLNTECDGSGEKISGLHGKLSRSTSVRTTAIWFRWIPGRYKRRGTDIGHAGQLPAVTVSFDLLPGLRWVMSTIIQGLAKNTLPATVRHFPGTPRIPAFHAAVWDSLLVVAILVVYIVLGILYESFIHPLTMLSGLPSAGIGSAAHAVSSR